jgi:hypothetical protein
MSVEPGLDRREWESIMSDSEDSLEEALPLLDELLLRMLDERGFAGGRRLPGRVRLPRRRAQRAVGPL